jgi:hypothetical protein
MVGNPTMSHTGLSEKDSRDIASTVGMSIVAIPSSAYHIHYDRRRKKDKSGKKTKEHVNVMHRVMFKETWMREKPLNIIHHHILHRHPSNARS